MSLSRSILAVVAALAIASPVFADDSASTTQNTSTTTTTQTATQTAQQVNLNTATSKELMKVKGITGSKAKAIVSYRKKHGNFNSVDDLSKVPGFTRLKTDKLKALTDQLTVG